MEAYLLSVIILNGSLKHQNHLIPIQEILEEEFKNVDLSTESILLNQIDIKSCIGCIRCWHTTPGICSGVKGDTAEEITKKVIQSEWVFFLTPLTFGGFSSELNKIIERMLGLLQPGITLNKGESHHFKRYERYPSILALATTEILDPEEEQIFKALVDRYSLNFYPPQHRAEVFLVGEDVDNIRDRIKRILFEMGLIK